MEPLERKQLIVDIVTRQGAIRLEDLAKHCGASAMTIRRDLIKLEENGFLTLNRGNVTLYTGTSQELSTALKSNHYAAEKRRISIAAAKMVADGSSIFLDCGTTVRELAVLLSSMKGLTVYTNSLLVANVLSNFSSIRLNILPGRFYERSMGFIDTSTYTFLQNLYFDIAFLGAEAAHPDIGFTVPDMDDYACKSIVAAHSIKTVILADSSKIGKRSRCTFAAPPYQQVLITDMKCPEIEQARFRNLGCDLVTV